ncbi:serine/threonine protein kinase [Saccharopolyspora rhizosphaerae]|uniref:non-specific serine/threonine protein kinase n=1 Tax=Saccharopolyspora rhizosphaerae TaxID=2492662 RepID=A0A3R8NYY6_9PSEU|nr:serine/threonine-protein kinase [Saccharopolyspora rhizosphaerae]RRO12870.1 serine/threonine protein kinase [Saccharopolyspora rhizosphaerae]
MSAEGRLIAGRYRLQSKIGSGAMGVVWKAVDERLHRTIAVKQLLLQPGYTPEETEEARQRSMREGRIAARLQHQNAIVVFDVAEDEGQPVLVMEYLPSTSLAAVIDEQGVQPPMRVARIGVQVAGALAAAHMAGIVHRDLKPGNILLGENDLAKITDFGISRAIGDVAVTKSGILAGTPAYLAPEVALGRDPAPASDVFSLGSTLYAAIEGGPPFGTDENAISLLHRVARGQFEPPRQAGPMTPVLMQMLCPDPVDRPTMAHTRDLLQAVLDGRPVPHAAPGAGAGWQRQQQPTAPTPPGGGAMMGHHQGSAGPANPPTRVGGAAPAVAAAPPRRAGKQVALWTVAIVVAVLVGVLAANAFGSGSQDRGAPAPAPKPAPTVAPATTTSAAPTSSAAPATSSQVPTSSSAPSTKKQVTKEKLVSTVKKYYTLVPDDLDDAWKLLGPSLQSQGKDRYEAFWKQIDDVKIIGQPVQSGANVVVTLQFTKDGKKSTEVHVLGMVANSEGDALINTDSRH